MADQQSIKDQLDIYLNDDHFDDEVTQKIFQLGPEAIKLLAEYASGGYPENQGHFQYRAILLLGETEDHGCVPVLEKLLTDLNEDIRAQAIIALGYNKSDRAANALEKAIDSQKCTSLELGHCVESLKYIRSPKAKATLEKLEQQDLQGYLEKTVKKAIHEYETF